MSDRSKLTVLRNEELRNTVVRISAGPSTMAYQLTCQLSQGKTSAAWAARTEGPVARRFAIKFVLKSDYATHSIYTEAARVAKLDHELFAQLSFYGEPEFSADVAHQSDFLAIAVDWVEGETLREFLAARSELSGDEFLGFVRDFCAALKQLRFQNLVHNDLHVDNVMVRTATDPMTLETRLRIKIIDTGTLKSEDRRRQLLDEWGTAQATLEAVGDPVVQAKILEFKDRIDGFSIPDQEWVICHLVDLFNLLRRSTRTAAARTRRFVRDLPALLTRMVDQKSAGSIQEPDQMAEEIEKLWHNALREEPRKLTTPFDLPYAELIRSDRQLMELFSDQYPGLGECRSQSPTYVYGPRGCGKSTVLRSLSLQAVLNSRVPAEELQNVSFFGVYVCCSSELRTRFLFLKEDAYHQFEGSIVRYFTLLLVEELVATLEFAKAWRNSEIIDFGFTDTVARSCVTKIRDRLKLPNQPSRYISESALTTLRHDLQYTRDKLWRDIINLEATIEAADAQAIFDVCKSVTEVCQFLQQRRIVFLLDDYSSQRIPATLQQKLNIAITFSKKSCPLFKVTSEYGGVDLTGLTEGREVRQVNVGSEYVALKGKRRFQFLKNVLNKRFRIARESLSSYTQSSPDTDIAAILGLSNLQPAVEMARAIRDQGKGFYYHGIDTIADLCSGDFATGLDLVQRIFDRAKVDWSQPEYISPKTQHDAIQAFAMHEFDKVLSEAPRGKRKYEIVERLSWLSHSYASARTAANGDPVVKTHLDIDDEVLEGLKSVDSELWLLFHELIRDGLLFPLQSSRSASDKKRTVRFMVRRILLAQHRAPLGRHTPIKFHDTQKLVSLLSETGDWAKLELEDGGDQDRPDIQEHQQEFDFEG